MKHYLAIGAGFVSAMAMFAGGIAVATTVITAEPEREPGPAVDVADVWSGEPRTVDPQSQQFERVASIAPLDQAVDEPEGEASRDGAGAIDPTITGAVGQDEAEDAAAAEREAFLAEREEAARLLVMDHVDWCSQHYRSYTPENNSYRPYSGGWRECVSPYLEEAMALMQEPVAGSADGGAEVAAGDYAAREFSYQASEADDEGALVAIRDQFDGGGAASPSRVALGADHVRECFSRYRSYRVEDNSYQPYGGGPRRQCE